MLVVACAPASANEFHHPDHFEFNAMLAAPFKAQGGRWPVSMTFEYPAAGAATAAAWTLDVLAPNGQIVASQRGITLLDDGRGQAQWTWQGKQRNGRALASGYYTFRLRAVPTVIGDEDRKESLDQRIVDAFSAFQDEMIEQTTATMVGNVAPARASRLAPLPVGANGRAAAVAHAKVASAPTARSMAAAKIAATGGLPYTIYYGNMHSQTNHSDGGTPVASCGGSEIPQGGTMGPADAYAMMQTQAGGDFLLTSEHNHMYDGSTGTNTSATPASANNLFNSGISAAATYRSAHPDFLALYGNEWGVINNGGHLNIINPDLLAEWEKNSSGQLIGGIETPKSDYAALYATMKTRGWIGQFNHPASSGQFQIGTTSLGYDANGADVMVLAEILNSSAFSTNTTQTETGRSTYDAAFNILLERGYKVAPSSDQDNHCANWGLSFTNRTGVLLPTGAVLNQANFYDALKARRAFATEDKTGQLVLTANGHVMGETFANTGALALTANYASTGGQTAQRIQFFEGVPGRNGTVTQLVEGSASYSFTPADGEHFYYALVTQANGLRLWSAPVWVSQGAGPSDTTPPSVSASETGTSGTISFAATASDNVGVSKVEFYVDGLLVGTDTAAPYSMTLDSTTLANGSHNLTAKAYDAAGNSTVSTAVAFSVNNVVADTTPPTVSASETGTSGSITLSATASDNVGVSRVEFSIDNALVGSDTTSPYTMAFDSTTLANGSHTLTAKAFDAAGNSTVSTAVAFSVNNVVADTTPPTVSASETGTSGTITLSATASDNVGVSQVEFFVDGVSKGVDTTSPYSVSLNSTLLANGSHSLVATARDAAGNSANSATVSFSVNNSTATQLIVNGGFESGAVNWTASSGVITNDATYAAHGGTWKAWLNGYGAAHTDTAYQTITIPSTATSATLTFWLRVDSDETTTTNAYDTLKVQVRNSSNTVLSTLATYSNLNKGTSYVQRSFSLLAYKGQTIRVYFEGVEGSLVQTSFLVDDVAVNVQ